MNAILGKGRRGRGREAPPPGIEEDPDVSGGSGGRASRPRRRSRRGRSRRRYIFLGVAALVLVAVCVSMVCTFTGGSSDDDLLLTFDDEPEAAGLEGETPADGADGDPALSVEEQVEATVEARMAVQSTPEYSATLQAQMEASRPVAGDSRVLGVLESEEERLPYLSPEDRDYLTGHGGYFWSLTQAWVNMRSILSYPIELWDYGWLSSEVRFMQELLDDVTAYDQGLSVLKDEGVGEVVLDYIGSVREARKGLSGSAVSIESSMRVFEESAAAGGRSCTGGEEQLEEGLPPGPAGLGFQDLCHAEREAIWALYTEASNQARQVNGAMSSYGCSICGEIFRASSSGVLP